MVKPRAPFRYWGAKVRMAPWVIERLPEHDHFVEGCAGSAAIMAAKPPVALETINDTYGEVVNFWRVLRDPKTAERLIDAVAFTPYALSDFRDAGNVESDDPVERAWAFFIRMQMAVVPGRSGWSYAKTGATGKRANKPGRWASMPELLQATMQRFDRVQATDWDIIDLIRRLDAPGVLILVDPPYEVESRPNVVPGRSPYVKDEFNHEAFVSAMHDARYASFAVTHYPHPTYDNAGLAVAGDYVSHRNIPNDTSGVGRGDKTERLYVLDRSGSTRD